MCKTELPIFHVESKIGKEKSYAQHIKMSANIVKQNNFFLSFYY